MACINNRTALPRGKENDRSSVEKSVLWITKVPSVYLSDKSCSFTRNNMTNRSFQGLCSTLSLILWWLCHRVKEVKGENTHSVVSAVRWSVYGSINRKSILITFDRDLSKSNFPSHGGSWPFKLVRWGEREERLKADFSFQTIPGSRINVRPQL